MIVEPVDGLTTVEGEQIGFESSIINATDPVTYTWSSDLDGELAAGVGVSTFSTSALSVGVHTITVVASDAAAAADDDSISLTVLEAPDLVVASISSPGDGYVDEMNGFSIEVLNQGMGMSAATQVAVSYSPDAAAGDDTFIANYAVPALMPGQSMFVGPFGPWGPPEAGTFWLVATVDPADTVAEGANEDNNTAVASESFTISERPDLVVTDIAASCATPTPGTVLEVTWTVTNNGGALDPVTLTDEVLLSDDAAIGGDLSLGTFSINIPAGLAPGGTYMATRSVVVPIDASGPMRLIVSADINDDVDEGPSGNANNTTIDDSDLDIPEDDTVTLFCWRQLGAPSAGNWNVASDGLSVFQTTNGNPTYFVSDFDLIGSQFQGTFKVETTSDDDYIGFVFGVQDVLDNGGGHYYMVSWKQNDQSGAERGLKLMKIIGPSPDLWNAEPTPGQIEMLARYDTSVDPAAPGWGDNVEYRFFLTNQIVTDGETQTGRIRVIVTRTGDGAEIWNTGLVEDPTPLGAGPVGFYNYSQASVRYSGFSSTQLQDPVSVPGGPYAFSASASDITLNATSSFDPDGAAGFAGIAGVQWDLGNDGFADDAGRTMAMQPLSLAEATGQGLAIGADIAIGLQVTDADGLTGYNVGSIAYESAPPMVDAGGPYPAVGPGMTLSLAGVVTDADLGLGVGEALTVEWDLTPGGTVGDGFADSADVMLDFATVVDLVSMGGNTFYLNVEDASGQVATAMASITLSFPDLVVTSVTAPSEAPVGSDITVNWTVGNNGNVDAMGTWEDRIYLSADANFDGEGVDTLLGSMTRTDLGTGATYDQMMTVGLPSSAEGSYYILVVTDAADVVEEATAEGNNAGASTGQVAVFTDCNENGRPDFEDINTTLVSSDCNGNGVPDECELELVYNENFEGAPGDEWSDTTTFDASVPATFSRFSGRFGNTSQVLTLPTVAGVGYTVTFDLYIIDSWDGDGCTGGGGADYFVVEQDGGEIFRHTFSTFGECQSYPGEPEFRENYGWANFADSIYRMVSISFTATGPETQITFRGEGLQELDDESWGLDNVRVLSEGSADCNGNGQLDSCDIADGTSMDVNGNGIPDECEPHPDLVADAVGTVDAALAGDEVEVTWAVSNDGDDVSAAAAWTDQIYLSSDSMLDGSDLLLGSFPRSGPLAAGGSYNGMGTVTLPGTAGTYYMILAVDGGDTVEEFDLEDNNVLADDMSITVNEAADLVVVDITAPSSAPLGSEIEVSWTVRNDGGEEATGPWMDRVLLLDDTGRGTIVLGDFETAGPLAPGATTTGSGMVTLPAGVDGSQRIAVLTDATNVVHEVPNEGNNQTSDDMTIEIQSPDLVVTDLVMPSTATTGQPVAVSWTVTNNGAAPASGTWFDQLLLSTDDAVGTDMAFGNFSHTGTLAPGESYTMNESVPLPAGVDGVRWLVVRTDFSNTLDEGSHEDNNAAADDLSFDIQSPDLVVTMIAAPASAGIGDSIAVSWTVRNDGAASVSGTWRDRVSLSTDDVAGGDLQVGDVSFTGSLAPGETYTQDISVDLPAGVSGMRYVVVDADGWNAVDEGSFEGNNTLVDDMAVDVVAPDLVVTVITAPSSAGQGSNIIVDWTVRNDGGQAVTGAWTDSVRLSTDPVAGNDVVLSDFTFIGTLNPGETYMRS
ncbi:MAG: hypothetical protein KDA21_05220, partial [Phycisphaerales bacterium]|nr:hypothetical protein [Phycisphaerales bacterium]